MNQLTITFRPLDGPMLERINSLAISAEFLKLVECIKVRELELSAQVGQATLFANGQITPSSSVSQMLLELEKVRGTIDTLERIIERKFPLSTPHSSIA